jgi:opacity protein-like surface antigen
MRQIIMLLCCLPLATAAQNFHFSARLGIANYQGDLQAKRVTFKQAKFLGSLGAQYDLSEHFTARTYFTLSSLQADDKKGTSTMQMRNLNFATKLFEWELGAQYNILSLNNSWFTPYVFAGIGLYHFKPYTRTADGTKTFLKELSTEGQGIVAGKKEYKLTQFNIPLGIGATYVISEDIRVGLELGYRKLFTDYLDDVSTDYVDQAVLLSARGQTAVDLAYRGDEVGAGPYPTAKTVRGGANEKDGFYYMALTVTVRSFIDQYKRIAGLPSYHRDKKVGCPSTRF